MSIEAEKLFFESRLKNDEGEVGIAAVLLHDIVARYPNFGKAYALLGTIYFKSFDDPILAETFFKKAIALSPDYYITYLDYAALLLSQERYTEQVAVLNKGLETTGVNKDKAWYYSGLMHERQKQFEEAIENFQKALFYSVIDTEIAFYQQAIERCLMKRRLG